MDWKKGDNYHLKSVPPGYTIAKIYMGEKVSYELWRGCMHISEHPIADAAKQAAEAHAERWEREAA